MRERGTCRARVSGDGARKLATTLAMLTLLRPALLLALSQAPAIGAPVSVRGVQLAREDSVRLVRSAHSAQSEFERFHRANLPHGYSEGSDACEVHIGRFCYWSGDDSDAGNIFQRSDHRA